MKTIKELEQEIQEIYLQKKELDNKIKLLSNKICEIRFGFENGQEILFNGKRGIISMNGSSYCLCVRLYKKDGELSSTIKNVYSSDIVKAI